MVFLSLDSGTDAQCAALRNEVDINSGSWDLDPLQILMREEEDPCGGCSFPQCYIPCKLCTK